MLLRLAGQTDDKQKQDRQLGLMKAQLPPGTHFAGLPKDSNYLQEKGIVGDFRLTSPGDRGRLTSVGEPQETMRAGKGVTWA